MSTAMSTARLTAMPTAAAAAAATLKDFYHSKTYNATTCTALGNIVQYLSDSHQPGHPEK